MSESWVGLDARGRAISFVGPDGTELFRVMTLRSSIKLHAMCGMIPTRGVTITRMFALASSVTHKSYKRGQHVAAVHDLTEWIEAMKCAIPIKTAA